MTGPVEGCPGSTCPLIAFDAPVASEGADDVVPVMSSTVGNGWSPRTAVVLNFDADENACADGGADGERTAGQAGVAMEGGVGGQFRSAQNHFIGYRAVVQ